MEALSASLENEVSQTGFIDPFDYYLQFSKQRISFEGISKSQLTNVFFDEANNQVYSIKSGDVTEVTVKSPIPNFCKHFKIVEKGRISSIKFSVDQSILALQRTPTAVDFLTFENGQVIKEFTHTLNSQLISYIWTGRSEIVLITNIGVTLCKVDVKKSSLNYLKNFDINVNWFLYYSPINLLLINKPYGLFQLLQIKQNQISNLVKFNVDKDFSKPNHGPSDRDFLLGVVYNQPRILYLNQLVKNSAEVIVYTIFKLSSVKRTHVLRVVQKGRFALNIVDNLIIVHNQRTQSSLVYDITNAEFQGAVKYFSPVLEPRSIMPSKDDAVSSKPCELYSPNWVIFQPNIVMDPVAGSLWFLEINLMGFFYNMANKRDLIGFLLLRSNSKLVISKTLEGLLSSNPVNLEDLSDIFDQINFVYRSYLEENMKSQMGLPSSATKQEEDPVVEFRTVIDQSFIYSSVFCKLAEKVYEGNKKESKVLTMALIEYIRSLTDFQIPAQHFLYELLINTLVIQKKFYQLYQLLQYRIVVDSKPLACLLLSLENVYNGATQLAIDMLERLGSAKEEIIEILLSKQQVLPAIRYAAEYGGPNDRNRFAKFIEVAKEKGDEKLCHTLSTYFKEHYKVSN